MSVLFLVKVQGICYEATTLDVLCSLASYDRKQSNEKDSFQFPCGTVLSLKPVWCFLNIVLLNCLNSSVKIYLNFVNDVNLFI